MSEVSTLRDIIQEQKVEIRQLKEDKLRFQERITRLIEQINHFKKQERDATLKALNLENENKNLKEYMARHNIHE